MFVSRIFRRLTLRHFFSQETRMDPTDYYNNRRASLASTQPYPYNFRTTKSIEDYVNTYRDNVGSGKEAVAGRVSSVRKHGRLSFIDIKENHHKVQVVVREVDGNIKRGDIVGVVGEPFVTQKGELSVKAESVQLLAPCLHMLPEQENLKDVELRYRKRHLDLITNRLSLQKLQVRFRVMRFLREYFTARGFLEVQTPSLSVSAGGAIAKPFSTHLHELDLDLHMRIAPELYLKQLLVGGVPKVFELGKNFRNEGMDPTHNPEFTSLQLYETYKNYEDMMEMTEDLLLNLVKEVTGGATQLEVNGRMIQFGEKWRRVSFVEGLEEATKHRFPTQFQSEESIQFLSSLCKHFKVECTPPRTAGRLLDKLSGHFLEGSPQPLFIHGYPGIMSPLAKPCPNNPHLTERFEGFINGWEVVNSYTELNDPVMQLRNTPEDAWFAECLEYGLPPCAGWGLGVDRLVMLLTNSSAIQEVIAFPLMKPIPPL